MGAESIIHIFCFYADRDKDLVQELEKRMYWQGSEVKVSLWHHGKIAPGKEWEREITDHFYEANIFLFLVSPDFMCLTTSNCYYSNKIRQAMLRQEIGQVRVIPVILRPTPLLEDASFWKLEPLPSNKKPITSWRNRDEAFLDVVEGIHTVVKEIAKSKSVGDIQCIYYGHTDSVNTVVWSPDGTHIASAGDDNTVHIWEVTTGQQICIYRGHNKAVNSIAWSPDSSWIASASNDNTVQIWEAMTGRHISTYRGHFSSVQAVAWSSSRDLFPWYPMHLIASAGTDKIVRIWDPNKANTVFSYKGHSSIVWSIGWSPRTASIASASDDNTVQIWGVEKTIKQLPPLICKHAYNVWSIAWSPDGKNLASGSSHEVVQVWDAKNGNFNLAYSGHSDGVRAVAWSPDNEHVASGSLDRTVQVWHAKTRYTHFIYKGHIDAVRAVAWSPDGTQVASGSADKTIHVWQVM